MALAENHKVSSFRYIDEVKAAIAKEVPEVQTFYSSGSLVDGVLNMGAPAILYCFIFFYLFFAGPGPWSVDAAMGRK